MFGIPVGLIIKAAIGLIVVVAIFGAIRSHDNGIRKSQKDADQVLIAACQSNETAIKDANLSLQTDVVSIGKERDEQSQAVKDWKGLAERAAKVASDNLQANQTILAQLSATQRDARAKAGRPAQKMTCEQTLNEIDNDSKVFALEREARAREILGLPKASGMSVK